uniref:Phorbol-ester/DAG-type domain-containing protein n=1 Tax=Branchiostoma floridae TaxID=7739 RepID=C3YET1_BRAFL|eukprot:XP_002605165.1 hypothetical protein BRAFLDRAFT_80898 [Branchiostoma floridae]
MEPRGTALLGSVCPSCMLTLPNHTQLQHHWIQFHCKLPDDDADSDEGLPTVSFCVNTIHDVMRHGSVVYGFAAALCKGFPTRSSRRVISVTLKLTLLWRINRCHGQILADSEAFNPSSFFCIEAEEDVQPNKQFAVAIQNICSVTAAQGVGPRCFVKRLSTTITVLGMLFSRHIHGCRNADVLPQDIESQSHTFKLKTFNKRPKSCSLCKQVIWNEGLSCRVCKYACHRKCEPRRCLTAVNSNSQCPAIICKAQRLQREFLMGECISIWRQEYPTL